MIGSDPPSDLAVLKIDGRDLPRLTLGDSERVRVGDIALAIGNPLGVGQTVTAGIISAKGRYTGLSDGSFEDFLQTDAPDQPGQLRRGAGERPRRASGTSVTGYWITTYRQSRATSLGPTYLPISFSNCACVFHGRYSLNSRTMRGPAPGMLRMSSSLAVFRFTGM